MEAKVRGRCQSQGRPKIPSKSPEAGREVQGRFPHSLPGTTSANTLILRSWPSELGKHECLSSKLHSVWKLWGQPWRTAARDVLYRKGSVTSVQFSHSVMSNSVTPWTAALQASLSITNFQSVLKLMSIALVMPSNHLIFCWPLLLLPSIFPSIMVFSNESALRIRWPNYWSFSFNSSPSNKHPGLISFRMDWLDLLAVQGTLKSILQHQSSKASILRCSAFITVQLLHPYMTTGKTIALTRRTFVGKVMSLLFNMVSRLVIAFLSKSKCLLIS